VMVVVVLLPPRHEFVVLPRHIVVAVVVID